MVDHPSVFQPGVGWFGVAPGNASERQPSASADGFLVLGTHWSLEDRGRGAVLALDVFDDGQNRTSRAQGFLHSFERLQFHVQRQSGDDKDRTKRGQLCRVPHIISP